MDLTQLPRMIDAIDYAAARLGYRTSAVREVTDKLRTRLMVRPYGPDMRSYAIELRGDLPWNYLGTAAFLDLQLERLADLLTTDEQRAEEAALAARCAA